MNDYLKNALLTFVGIVAMISLVFIMSFVKPVVVTNTNTNSFPSMEQGGNGLGGAPGNMLAENYDPYIMYNGGYNSDKDMNIGGTFTGVAVTLTGTLTGVAANFSGLIKSDAGHLKSYVNSTSTADTTQTLALADINMYDRIIMTPTVGATTITYPASSTLATFLPTAGDSASQCWINGTSTASQTLTFTAGTGWDFDIGSPYATTTTLSGSNISLYAIPALGKACVEYTRMPATATTFDLKAAWTFYAL